MARKTKASKELFSQDDLIFIAQWCCEKLVADAVKDKNKLHNILVPTVPWLSKWKAERTETSEYVPDGSLTGKGQVNRSHFYDNAPRNTGLQVRRTVKATGLSLKVGKLELGYIRKTVTFENEQYPTVREVQKYEPRQYSMLTLLRVKVFEKIGRFWRERGYWRIAGEHFYGRDDSIKCDGPNLAPRSSFVPANYRRAMRLEIARKERDNNLVGQQKRYRIASVPIAIRFERAKQLKYRLDAQASDAFAAGNMTRYDALDNRANAVANWLAHIAKVNPGLSLVKLTETVDNISTRKRIADKNALLTGRTAPRVDKIAAAKLRAARVARAESFKSGRRAWK